MSKPVLLVIAGCNGSGKSTFSKPLSPDNFTPFDYDREFLRFYNSLIDSDIREAMAHRLAFNELENQIKIAIENKFSFCYETNFNSTPFHWPELFKTNGYDLHLIFLCLDSILEAKKRVAIRVENGGHFVPDNEIQNRYYDGYRNLNSFFKHFDYVDLYDSSKYLKKPSHILSIESAKVLSISHIPNYLNILIPNIIKEINWYPKTINLKSHWLVIQKINQAKYWIQKIARAILPQPQINHSTISDLAIAVIVNFQKLSI